MPTVLEYQTELGVSPFKEWFDQLDILAARKVKIAITRIELGNLGDVRPVGEGVSERRIDFGPGYRVYFGKDGADLVILLAGGTKRRQQQDIQKAKALWSNYKKRKKTR